MPQQNMNIDNWTWRYPTFWSQKYVPLQLYKLKVVILFWNHNAVLFSGFSIITWNGHVMSQQQIN